MEKVPALFAGFGVLFALGAGCVMALQPAVNARLASRCGHPLQASIVSFGTGFLCLVLLGLILQVGVPKLSSLQTLPAWAWTGGVLGAYMVTVSLLVAPQLGATRWIALVLSGQLALSLILDHFGLVGFSKQPMNWTRLLGVTCVVVGTIIVMRK